MRSQGIGHTRVRIPAEWLTGTGGLGDSFKSSKCSMQKTPKILSQEKRKGVKGFKAGPLELPRWSSLTGKPAKALGQGWMLRVGLCKQRDLAASPKLKTLGLGMHVEHYGACTQIQHLLHPLHFLKH